MLKYKWRYNELYKRKSQVVKFSVSREKNKIND